VGGFRSHEATSTVPVCQPMHLVGIDGNCTAVRAASECPPCRTWYGYDPADGGGDCVSRLPGPIMSEH
jgi:hypothetical protein